MREAMSRKKFLKQLTEFMEKHNNDDITVERFAEITLKEIERLGMVPVSKYCGFMSYCTIYDWSENITDKEISYQMDRQTDRD